MLFRRSASFFRVVCVLFMVGSIGLFVIIDSLDNQSKKNTTELSGTVKKVEFINTEKELHYLIYIEERELILNVSTNISKKINGKLINDLQKGDIVFFRVENEYLSKSDASFINIVSLKTNNNEVYSLSDYNQHISKSVKKVRIVPIVLFVFFSICLLKTVKTKTGDGSLCSNEKD